MVGVSELTTRLCQQAEPFSRYIIGIAGPPACGKSTLAEDLCERLTARGETAIVVPMDGFHFDDVILNARGHRPRKGAPHTFDVASFSHLLARIKSCEPDIAIPVFDRSQELSRAAAGIISAETKFIVVEGNYLLLNHERWRDLKPLFDFTVFLSVPEAELERRLLKRWRKFGFDEAGAREKAYGNDIPNGQVVMAESAEADLVISGGS